MSCEVFGQSLGQKFMDLNCKHKLEQPLSLERELDLIRGGLEKAREVRVLAKSHFIGGTKPCGLLSVNC